MIFTTRMALSLKVHRYFCGQLKLGNFYQCSVACIVKEAVTSAQLDAVLAHNNFPQLILIFKIVMFTR